MLKVNITFESFIIEECLSLSVESGKRLLGLLFNLVSQMKQLTHHSNGFRPTIIRIKVVTAPSSFPAAFPLYIK
jgi:hypothetical protein